MQKKRKFVVADCVGIDHRIIEEKDIQEMNDLRFVRDKIDNDFIHVYNYDDGDYPEHFITCHFDKIETLFGEKVYRILYFSRFDDFYTDEIDQMFYESFPHLREESDPVYDESHVDRFKDG